MHENEIGRQVVDAAITIHKVLGPGLLESVYEAVLAAELIKRGCEVKRQVPISIQYEGLVFEEAFRADLLVEDLVILELKSVDGLNKSHYKQLQTYLRLSQRKLGYLLNFNAAIMKEGVFRVVNGLVEPQGNKDPFPS